MPAGSAADGASAASPSAPVSGRHRRRTSRGGGQWNEDDIGEEEIRDSTGSISCIGYGEYYSASLSRAMGGVRGGVVGGPTGSRGPKIFCKGLTMIPVAERTAPHGGTVGSHDRSRSRSSAYPGDAGAAGTEGDGVGDGAARPQQHWRPKAGDRGAPPGSHPSSPPSSSRPWAGHLDLGLPTTEQVVDFSNNLYRLVPLVYREASKASATFSRNAMKVINKMGQNVKQTSAFVFGAGGGGGNGGAPPPREPRPPPPS